MDRTTIASRFEEAKAKALSAKDLCFKSSGTYKGPALEPTGILAWEDIAPDSFNPGRIRYYLVIVEHVPPQDWPFGDDGSLPAGTEGLLLAQLDDNLELMDWDAAAKRLGVTFEVSCSGGSMEMLCADYEGTRNFSLWILFNALRSTEE